MKKVILMAVCLFAISTITKAQEAPKKPKTESHNGEQKGGHEKKTPEERAKKHVEELNAEVTLTEEQKPKIHDLALDKIKKVDEIKAKYKGQPENKETAKKEIEAVRKSFRENVKAVLTPAQIETLKAKHKEKKAAGKPNALDQD
jgi:Spy/CpxP family protein refolding chaperone